MVQRHANIKMHLELIQLTLVNVFLCTCVQAYTLAVHVVNVLTAFFLSSE